MSLTPLNKNLVTERLTQIIRSEDVDINPMYGYGIEVTEYENEVSRNKGKPVRYVSSKIDNEAELSLNTFGAITTVNALFWSFAKTARDTVLAMVDVINLGYKTDDDNFNAPKVSPFRIGGVLFWWFRPVGGYDQLSERFGTIFMSEQLIRIQFQFKE